MTGTTVDHLPEAPMLELLGEQLKAMLDRVTSAATHAETPREAADLTRLACSLSDALDGVRDSVTVAAIYCTSPAAETVLTQRRRRREAAEAEAIAAAEAAEAEAAAEEVERGPTVAATLAAEQLYEAWQSGVAELTEASYLEQLHALGFVHVAGETRPVWAASVEAGAGHGS